MHPQSGLRLNQNGMNKDKLGDCCTAAALEGEHKGVTAPGREGGVVRVWSGRSHGSEDLAI